MEQVYVIKVRCAPPPTSQVLPSERRYSAHSVFGISCVHLIITVLTSVLSGMRAHATGLYFWPLTFVILSSFACGISGLLAWHRWYQGIFIRGFLVTATVSCCTCSAVVVADIFTATNLGPAAVHNVILVCIFESLWSVISCVVAWKGVRNKSAGDEIIIPSSPLKPIWKWDEDIKKESEARVMEYLRNTSRPPVEGKEKCSDDDVTADPA